MKNEKNYKTQQIWVKKGHRMHAYFKEMCENGKNMYNVTNFYIRQVYTGLKSDEKLKPLQQEVLDVMNKQLPKMNDVQLKAYQKKFDKEKRKPKEEQKDLKVNLFELPSDEKPYVNYNFLDALFKSMSQNDYRSLPTQTSQTMMKQTFSNWKGFFESLSDYKENPKKYKCRPKIPIYSKAKEKTIEFTNQDCVIKENKYLKFPKTKQKMNIGKLGLSEGKLKVVRVVPKYGDFVVEIVNETAKNPKEKESQKRLMSIDLGIDNLATITTNTGKSPELVKGKRVKYVNQYYNKQRAHFLGVLRNGKETNQGPFTSKKLECLHQKRHRKIKDVFHKVSKYIADAAEEEGIDTIVIGLNKDWKQNADMGKRNNQSFINIPHSMLMNMIKYKASAYGIKVMKTEESYTSKSSFLDDDVIPAYQKGKKHIFIGKRVKRGLYRSNKGFLINADVNGSANILKKYYTKTFKENFDVKTINVWKPKTIFV